MHFNEKHLTKPIKCRGAYTLHSKTICQFCVHKEVDTEVLSAFSSQLNHFNCVCNKFGARFLLCFSCCVSNSCFFIQRQQINRKNIVGTFDVRVCFFFCCSLRICSHHFAISYKVAARFCSLLRAPFYHIGCTLPALDILQLTCFIACQFVARRTCWCNDTFQYNLFQFGSVFFSRALIQLFGQFKIRGDFIVDYCILWVWPFTFFYYEIFFK